MSIQLSGADVMDLAIQTESRGEQFYREAAARAENPDARQLFTYLADEEVRHKQVFQQLSGAIVTVEIEPTMWEEVEAYIEATVDWAFFNKPGSSIRTIPQAATVADMVQQAIAFEKDTLLFFYTLRDLVQSPNRPLVDQIVDQEKSHIRHLAGLLKA